ncbi:MAG: DUF362 domain-containing protein, partial [Myxococcota bacterium]
PAVLKAVIRYFKASGARNVYVIENCTQANFTRLVFHATGYTDLCRDTGAIPVFLDETPAVKVTLKGLDTPVEISKFVRDLLIDRRDEVLYVSVPKLKTHSMSQVTLSVKNQYGLVHQHSRGADHNFNLHGKLAGIYALLRPDFALVDGLIATNHGHYVAEGNSDRCVVPMNVLLGGTDPLAVDVVGSALMGFSLEDVEHLSRCADTGIGVGDINKIAIINRQLFDERKRP